MDRNIGSVLKRVRINAGLSVEEVSAFLTRKGYRASEKTVYSWESGNSQPKPDILLELCNLYEIRDVLGTFGYVSQISAPQTMAAHFDGDEYTPEELEEISNFAKFVKQRRSK